MSHCPSASLTNLRLRAALLAKLRAFFAERGFLEVETPLLSADVVVDRHLDPLSTILFDDPRRPEIGQRLWLQTSPEFGMKRLLAAGSGPIFQVTRAFRGGEVGPLHNPEFTIVEWYRPGDTMAAGMTLLDDVCAALLNTPPAERVSYADAFLQHVGLDPHRAPVPELAAAAQRLQLSAPASLGDDRDGWLNFLLSAAVEPRFSKDRPTILYDYPSSQAALARVREEASRGSAVAERFELYVRGIELANGYHELLDARVLRERNRANNAARVADGKPPLPEESQLLTAMDAGMPPCCGVALGFDRVAMLAAGAKTLTEVMAFPIERA